MNRTQIAPGAFVTSLPGEKFKRCKVAIRLVLPAKRETATALALLPHLLDRRCAVIPDAIALSRRLYSLYGAEIASESFMLGANRVVTIGISGLRNEYALAGEDLEAEYAELACQLLFAPVLENGVFSAQDVAIEKEKQADYLRSEMNEKRTHCLQQARRKLFGSSPLGIETSGYVEDIDALTPQNLYEAYQDILSRAQVEVTVFGMSPKAASEKIARHLVALPRNPVTPSPLQAAVNKPTREEYTEPMEALQGKLCLMFTTGQVPTTRDMAIMRVATAILGGLPTSRLFMNVREKQSLCYYCASGFSADTGVLTIDSGVEHANLQKAADAILHELTQLQTAPATEQELDNAKIALEGAFTSSQDSPAALESWAFANLMRGLELDMQEFAALIQTVSHQEVQAALASFKPALQYAITQKEGKV